MFTVDMNALIPKFILNDRNGRAVAAGIGAALQTMNDTIEAGVKCLTDYDSMPEWRLDEMAWETNCLYDFSADVEQKRVWIRDALPMYRLFGTPKAVKMYLDGYFDNVVVREGPQPYHFSVTVEGAWTPENEAWARAAIAQAKNVRSELDGLRSGVHAQIAVTANGGPAGYAAFPVAGEHNVTPTWP